MSNPINDLFPQISFKDVSPLSSTVHLTKKFNQFEPSMTREYLAETYGIIVAAIAIVM